jgi:hypothetical protein
MKKITAIILMLLLTSSVMAFTKNTPLKDIKQQLGPNYELVFDPKYNIDFGAIVAKSHGQTLFALLTDPTKAPNDETTFSTVIIESPDIKTNEGIGVGSLISDAVKVYGPVELSYNLENESREFAVFAHGPKDILFRTGTEDEAGIYQKGSYSTKQYKKDAKIKWLIVYLP